MLQSWGGQGWLPWGAGGLGDEVEEQLATSPLVIPGLVPSAACRRPNTVAECDHSLGS